MTQAALQVPPPPEPVRPARTPFNLLVEWFRRTVFALVRLEPEAVERIRTLARQGSVIYVLRHRSWFDYALVSYVLRREGLPVPEFVNGLSDFWFRSLGETVSVLWKRLRGDPSFSRELREFEERNRCLRLVAAGRPVLIFMRGGAPTVRIFAGRRRAIPRTHTGSDYLREIVHHLWESRQEVSLVPIAVFRGRGMRRKDARMHTAVYSLQEVPTELRRVVSYLWNARDTSIRVGGEVRLREFLQQYQHEGEERLVRRLARALQIFLYREERLVWGPPLIRKREVRNRVLGNAQMKVFVRQLAEKEGQPEAEIWRRADRYFYEMAANFHGFYFSILEFLFNRIWPRVFQGLEYSGLDKVIECVKQHPVVLVPCHRSHFDYLILSYIFHLNYLSPPHIAAGINLSFWPMGPLFRGAGAYFIRRSFEGNDLYKMVFRQYLTFLIREGYTQEFFIEGGRSRTGKILTPKLGMLTGIVESFLQGARRDLYFVPVSIHYGRVVEEESYQRELGGGEKEKESLGALVKARSVLRRRHGTVYVTFADPISLADRLGERRERFRTSTDPAVEEEKRRFIHKLGFRILREVNNATVPGATSVSATVLLNHPHAGCRRRDFVPRALALTDYLRHCNLPLTASLERNSNEEFRESLAFLESGGLVRRLPSEDGDVIYVPAEKRLALDFYKNNTIHFFLLATLVTDRLRRGLRGEAFNEEIRWWLDFFRWEFPLPERETLADEIEDLLEYLRRIGALCRREGAEVLVEDHPFVQGVCGSLDNFRESYWIAAEVLRTLPEEGWGRKAVTQRMHQRYQTGLLLGEVRKPEGNSSVTLGNAISRYAEMGCIAVVSGKGKDALLQCGPRFAELDDTARRIYAALGKA